MQNTLKNLILTSTLSQQDKDDFIVYVVNFSDIKSQAMYKTFNENPDKLVMFWTVQQAKNDLLTALCANNDLSGYDKDELTHQIIDMEPEEFKYFLKGLTAIHTSQNTSRAFEELNKANLQAHEKFMNTSSAFLHNLQDLNKKATTKKDTLDYETTLDKINMLE